MNMLEGENRHFYKEIEKKIREIQEGGKFILGNENHLFENELEAYLMDYGEILPPGGCNVVTCASGTDALRLVFRAMNLRPGDEVIQSVFNFIAAAEMTAECGGTPVFVDIKRDDCNINPDLIEEKITKNTRAIIATNLFGVPADYTILSDIAEKYKLILIEDAAQSFGATYGGRKAGTLGDVSVLSFYPTKILGCWGDGGAVVTKDAAIKNYLKMIRNHGQGERYEHDVIGMNSRLDEIQAGILRLKLESIGELLTGRKKIAERYRENLSHKKMIFVNDNEYGCRSAAHANFTVLLKDDETRAGIIRALADRGLFATVHYPLPINYQKAFLTNELFPVADEYCERILSLPVTPFMAEDTVDDICEIVNFNA